MAKNIYKVKAILGIYPSEHATWYAITLPVSIADEIYQKYKSAHGGFRSLKVEVKLGNSVWQTSIFRDSSARSYIMFIKAGIRKREQVLAGDAVELTLSIL